MRKGGEIKQFSLALILILMSLGISSCVGSRAQNADNKNAAANANQPVQTVVAVTAAAAISRQMPTFFEATGTLAGDAQTDVAPLVGGKIVQVNFDVGSYVKKGDVLVRLDDRDARIKLEQAQAQVAQQQRAVEQAQANVGQAEANVKQAEANVRQTRERLGLSGNQKFDVYQIAEVKNAKATLDLAERELRRYERLVETGDVPRSTYDQRKTQRDQAQAQYDTAINTARQSYAGIASAESGVGTAQSGVGTAQAAVRNAQAAVDTLKVQIDQANKAISDAVIYAPISGSIAERVADVGEFIGTNGKIATIVQTGTVRMRIEVPEQSISQVHVGQSVSLNVSDFPDRNFAGTIARISPNLNTTSRTLTAEAEVENTGNVLKPGQFATVRILLPQTEATVLVPATAVRTDGTTNRVFVIKDGRAEQRLLQIGQNEGDLVQVKNGVAADEKVATSNLEQLVDGIAVQQ